MNRRLQDAAALLTLIALLSGCASSPQLAGSDLPRAALDSEEHLVVIAFHNPPGTAAPRPGSTPRGYVDAGRYTVGFRTRNAMQAVARDYGLDKLAEWPIELLQIQCAVYAAPDGVDIDQLLSRLADDGRVHLAQRLQAFHTQSSARDAHGGMQSALEQMDIVAAHRHSLGDGVRVAVVDTGVDTSHPLLAGRIDAIHNFVDADARQFRLDRHGTAVSGVIAANNSGAGLVGVAPRARLVALKACWQLQAGADAAKCNSYTLAQAMAMAIDQRVQIINLSLTGPPDPLLDALTRRAIAAGIVVIGPVAENNAGFPASVPGVIEVSSAERGAAAYGAIRAPGSDILSLAPDGRYAFFSGDSIATAAVSGVVALMLAEQPRLPRDQLGRLMNDATATVTTSHGATNIVSACRALNPADPRECSRGSAVAGSAAR